MPFEMLAPEAWTLPVPAISCSVSGELGGVGGRGVGGSKRARFSTPPTNSPFTSVGSGAV